METWLMYVMDILIFFCVLMGWAWWQRSKYSKAVSPTKDAPNGKLLAEFWPETRMRYKRLLAVEVNGCEVKAPKGHQCPRYFFNKEVTWMTKYPESPIFNLKFLQVEVPIVSWPENCPEPINPKYMAKQVASSALIDSLRDNDFMAFAMAASQEIQELQRELASALATKLDKRLVYALLIGAVAAAALAAIFGFQILDYVQYMDSKWGQ